MAKERNSVEPDEIDLLELVKVIWSKRLFILKVTTVFVVLGLLIAFTSPEEYKSSSTLITEAASDDGKLGSLGGLASLAGIDLGGVAGPTTSLSPGLYESIAKSTPFMMEVMYHTFLVRGIQDSISLHDYILEHQKSSLISKIISLPLKLIDLVKPKGKSDTAPVASADGAIVSLNEDEKKVTEFLNTKIAVGMDWDLNVVNIQVEMQNAEVAAQVNLFVIEYITRYVSEYATSKTQNQLEFVEKQLLEKKADFENAQLNLARFRDANKNINSANAKTEEERLQSEYNLTFNIYNQLAQQREQVKLMLRKEIPVFTILEPAVVPLYPESPTKKIVVLLFMIGGVFFACLWILFKSRAEYIGDFS